MRWYHCRNKWVEWNSFHGSTIQSYLYFADERLSAHHCQQQQRQHEEEEEEEEAPLSEMNERVLSIEETEDAIVEESELYYVVFFRSEWKKWIIRKQRKLSLLKRASKKSFLFVPKHRRIVQKVRLTGATLERGPHSEWRTTKESELTIDSVRSHKITKKARKIVDHDETDLSERRSQWIEH
jgi:hypothetical protein